MNLLDIPYFCDALIVSVNTHPYLKRRLKNMGLKEKVKIKKIKSAPMGDPIIFCVKNVFVAIRKSDALKIFVEKV